MEVVVEFLLSQQVQRKASHHRHDDKNSARFLLNDQMDLVLSWGIL